MAEDLKEKLRGRGWQPARAEMQPLFELLGTGDRDEAELAERALARLGATAAEAGVQKFSEARPPARGRLVRLVGRVAAAGDGEKWRGFLLEALADEDARSRRSAAQSLGKLPPDEKSEAALCARWPLAAVEERRSLAETLGKVGGAPALALLAGFHSDDPELERLASEARLKLGRTLGRASPGRIDPSALPGEPLPVVFRCRHGLQQIVAAEVKERLGPALVVDDETVAATLRASPAQLQSVRTALRFAFPLTSPARAKDLKAAVVAALGSPRALAVFRAFTDGPIRYRIEWASAGRRRGLTFRTAEEVSRARPELVNDPTASLWELHVDEKPDLKLELWPRGLEDSRFAYRLAQLPASSHPTLAAALARVAGVRADDVVWDPFVGAGSELIERARLGPLARLFGSDLQEGALAAARKNLEAAGVTAELSVGDARSFRPPLAPTLILTNPPLGRRVLNKQLTGALYDDFLAHAARLLAPGGRLVWISPRPDHTAQRAAALGLRATLRQRVDMAGFWAELQAFILKK